MMIRFIRAWPCAEFFVELVLSLKKKKKKT